MITKAFLELGVLFMGWVAGLLPSTLPSWLSSFAGDLGSLVAACKSWAVWVPWSGLKALAIGLFAFWAVCFGVKLVLRLISYIPFFGGAG